MSRPVELVHGLPGEVLTLGGRSMRVVRTDGAAPPVVLVGGCGVGYYMWNAVVAALPGVEVLRPDRPGLAGTPWPGVLPTLRAEVDSLADLLGRLDGPAVVVGHSMGGDHVEALARRHPELVAGVVLTDSSVEARPRRPTSGRFWLATSRATHAVMQVPPLRPVGSFADRVVVAAQSRRRGLFDQLPRVERRAYRDPETAAMVVAEQAAYEAQIWDLMLLREYTPWPDIPAVVLTCAANADDDWVAIQRELAEMLSGRQIVVPSSHHMIMLDRPDVVAEAVQQLR